MQPDVADVDLLWNSEHPVILNWVFIFACYVYKCNVDKQCCCISFVRRKSEETKFSGKNWK
jgi:hypothetical protein